MDNNIETNINEINEIMDNISISENIHINVDQDCLFFDMSYCIFYRYYATFNWLKKFKESDVKACDIMEDETFMDKYPKLFEKAICDLVKLHKIKWENVFIVKDCIRDTIWRNDHFENYKGSRDDKLETFNKDIFKYTYSTFLPELKKKFNFNIINHDRLEADDVIALSKNYIRNLNSHSTIIIITNDNDYIQLLDNNTIIKNLQGKELRSRINVSPEMYLKIKVLFGDRSDNIPSIMKKVGIKTAEKLAENDDNFQKFCQKNPDALKQYNLNKLLIDFNGIPNDLRNDFIKRIVIKTI
jgi:5'-3' exonuclease